MESTNNPQIEKATLGHYITQIFGSRRRSKHHPIFILATTIAAVDD
jgi:hypothetical protein